MSGADWIAQARAEGLVPAGTDVPERPWPVVLLTALGAWLAVPPFLFLFAMLFGGDWDRGPMPYIEGIALIALSVVLLRARAIPLFLEQAAVPLLPTGLVCLGYGLQRDLSHAGAAWIGLAIGAALIVLLKQGWLRGLLGVGMAALAGYLGHLWIEGIAPRAWYEWDGGLSLMAAAMLLAEGGLLWLLQTRLGRDARTASAAAALESALSGWWVAVLVMHAVAAGWSFTPVGAFSSGDMLRGLTRELTSTHVFLVGASRALSALLALAGAMWLLRRWRPTGAARLLPPVLLMAALSALMPALGGILLVLALMASTRRWRLAALAGAAAVWAIGALYYEWQLPLAHKSLALVAAGAALAAWVRWLAWHPAAPLSDGEARPALALRGAAAVLLGAGVLSLVLVNVLIASREQLIANGRPVFVKLAPVDPRSLMQGDYMQLSYDLPGVSWSRTLGNVTWTRLSREKDPLWGHRLQIAATVDARGVVQSARMLEPGEASPAGAQLLELTPKDGRWTFVSDAWFFKEGEAERWQPAKYGEFRVTPEGKGLLVRVVGEDLKPL
ncbi:GDYXXLXY domain-containing protein [Roseateles sp. UC29_93]|uniref:GDYXXLXY domain-containing protein n=1 Tax=Roseateles sp. UC29_93 TaxID=3350177 RepID=UPI00366C7083